MIRSHFLFAFYCSFASAASLYYVRTYIWTARGVCYKLLKIRNLLILESRWNIVSEFEMFAAILVCPCKWSYIWYIPWSPLVLFKSFIISDIPSPLSYKCWTIRFFIVSCSFSLTLTNAILRVYLTGTCSGIEFILLYSNVVCSGVQVLQGWKILCPSILCMMCCLHGC